MVRFKSQTYEGDRGAEFNIERAEIPCSTVGGSPFIEDHLRLDLGSIGVGPPERNVARKWFKTPNTALDGLNDAGCLSESVSTGNGRRAGGCLRGWTEIDEVAVPGTQHGVAAVEPLDS